MRFDKEKRDRVKQLMREIAALESKLIEFKTNADMCQSRIDAKDAEVDQILNGESWTPPERHYPEIDEDSTSFDDYVPGWEQH